MKKARNYLSRLVGRLRSVLIRAFAVLMIAFFTYDLILLLVIKSPPSNLRSNRAVYDHLIYLYHHYLRDTIHDNPLFTEYDPELAYRLKTGQFTYTTPQFTSDFEVNSAGLRDDESSLNTPEIITLGDSQTMGWGVQQDQTYTSLLEKRLRKKALNAGLSDYGTVRNLKLLQKMDLSHLRYLIFQYSEFAALETEEFIENGFIAIPEKEGYDTLALLNKKASFYFPGKLAYHSIRFLRNAIPPSSAEAPQTSKETGQAAKMREAESFLKTLENLLPEEAKNSQIIFFETSSECRLDARVSENIHALIATRDYPDYIKNIRVLDTRAFINEDTHCRLLDTHMNESGHNAVAQALAETILEMEK